MDAAQVGLLNRVMNLALEAFAVPDRNKSAGACEMNGKMYSHGFEIREGARILECIDGRWEERIDFFVTAGPWEAEFIKRGVLKMRENKRAEVEQRVFDYFQSGFNCAEAVSKAMAEFYSKETHTAIPAVATGFGGGVGGSKAETCGALNGGIIAIGYIFGRKEPKDDKKAAYEFAAEFRGKFIETFGASTCRTILERFGEQENLIECKKLTARAAGILYTMLDGVISEVTCKA